MTVEEAREKTCCIKDRLKDNMYYCTASGCMAWRWCDVNTKHEGYCGLAGKEGAE